MLSANRYFPSDIASQYSGLRGFKDAYATLSDLGYGPGAEEAGDLATSSASDPAGMAYQAGTAGAGGVFGDPNAYLGLFSQMINNLMGARAQGQAAQQNQSTKAMQGIANVGADAASSMAAQQKGKLAVTNAQNQQQGDTLGLFTGILNQLTSPKGMGTNILGAFGGTPGQSPLGALWSASPSLSSLFSGGSGLAALAGSSSEALPGAMTASDLFTIGAPLFLGA